MNVIPFRKKRESEIKEVILRKDGPVIYVDFALLSMVKSVEDWYLKHFQGDDKWGTMRKAHMFHTIRFYEPKRFRNHDTIGKERGKYLDEVDIYVQMRRDD